jgi:hypothetical protein
MVHHNPCAWALYMISCFCSYSSVFQPYYCLWSIQHLRMEKWKQGSFAICVLTSSPLLDLRNYCITKAFVRQSYLERLDLSPPGAFIICKVNTFFTETSSLLSDVMVFWVILRILNEEQKE